MAHPQQEFPGIAPPPPPRARYPPTKSLSKQEVVACKQNVRAACQKDKLEFKWFFLALTAYREKKTLQCRFLHAKFKKKHIRLKKNKLCMTDSEEN